MYEKTYEPKIIGLPDKWNWIKALMTANCPDKLLSTAFAIADYVHKTCVVSKCIKSEGDVCNDFGWAFPEQKTQLPPINNKNESTTSKAIKALVEQGWLIKESEKKNRKEEKNFFALAYGESWEVKETNGEQLRNPDGSRKGGRRKASDAVVESNNHGLFNLTTTDCSVQQPPVVESNKVNINNKHELETLTVNVNTPAAPGIKVKVIDMNILDSEGKRLWGATRKAGSVSSSFSLTSEYTFDGKVLKGIERPISNTLVVESNNQDEEIRAEVQKIVDTRTIAMNSTKRHGRVVEIMSKTKGLEGTPLEVAEQAAKMCGLGVTEFEW